MITKPTVLILGAGASQPYGFPVGGELVSRICEMEFDSNRTKFLQHIGIDGKNVQQFFQELRQSQQPSIDAFLEHRPEFMDVGKLVIAQQLIECETNNELFYPGEMNEDKWYRHLLNTKLNTKFEDFADNKLSVVTFNYDRSFEHFLHSSLQSRYDCKPDEVADVLKQIPIIHVHGQMGMLPWQENPQEKPVREYDTTSNAKTIKDAAAGIKIVTEGAANDPEFGLARELIIQAERVFFLGFHYHPENMGRLCVPLIDKPNYSNKRLFRGTGFGFTPAEFGQMRDITYRGLVLGNEYHKTYRFLRNDDVFLEI